MPQGTFFGSFARTAYTGSWQPQAPPPLDNIHEIELDTETTGLCWWDGHLPIGIAIRLPDGRKQYLPWGHTGGNLDENVVRRWARTELRNKHITNLNTRFDLHMLYAWGVDLECQGCSGELISSVKGAASLMSVITQLCSTIIGNPFPLKISVKITLASESPDKT
jgi:hypothetical protein